ncbi:hypothetical protein I7I50_05074 [Histoplasma capsulatum G186AR]|uniref:Uncharacterized protein n=1 Tax=Ajellomyces capsulatus TaxID=5037 RepID=A0A8H7Z6F8_AJECA|nr:hypothetical protein I7I52_03332 [Histoplasma capsulatum]QSS75811.1 hypothetical protein I7I50_05074 [Histoplasma capsulatum G186AR]
MQVCILNFMSPLQQAPPISTAIPLHFQNVDLQDNPCMRLAGPLGRKSGVEMRMWLIRKKPYTWLLHCIVPYMYHTMEGRREVRQIL